MIGLRRVLRTTLPPLLLTTLPLLVLTGCPKKDAKTNAEASALFDVLTTRVEPVRKEIGQDPHRKDPATSATFRGRTVDIAPHIAGFPYRSFLPYPELGVMLYMHEGPAGRTLRSLPLAELPNLDAGRPLNDIDWTKRSFRQSEPLPKEDAILFVGDEDNREDYDLYKLFLADGRVERVTDVPYVYGFGVDARRDRVAYVARYPIENSTEYRSCLELLALPTGPATTVVCDDAPTWGGVRFTWTDVSFSPDGVWAYVKGNLEGDRKRGQLLRIRLDGSAALERLTDDAPRSVAGTVQEWLDADRYVSYDDAGGFTNLTIGTLSTGTRTRITDLDVDLKEVAVLHAGRAAFLLAVVGRPWESELRLLDPSGEVLAKRALPDELSLLHAHQNTAYFYVTSRSTKMKVVKVMVSEFGGFIVTPLFGLPPELEERLDQCVVERVAIPTFDLDPATKAPRLLHAYLSTPRTPPPATEPRLAGVVAFYGGGNHWDTQAEILCEAGVTTLSAAVRGSAGFGAEFYGLNDGDLGGDEIVDLQHLGRWLVETKGFAARDIGVYGGSHGGYAAMRALTFPPATNARNAQFDWGWGVSFFGFSDIKTFWETCNIPDWVLLEVGDPATEPEKIRERSPLFHVDRLDAPILLLHGENDQRVPVLESRQFADACAKAHKDCTYVEFPGQGHGLNGIANQVRVVREWFAHLERARPLPSTP